MSESQQQYFTARHLRQRFGASRMWIFRRMNESGFPQPITFGGRLRYWRVADVLAWEKRMIARGTERAKPPQKKKPRRAA